MGKFIYVDVDKDMGTMYMESVLILMADGRWPMEDGRWMMEATSISIKYELP